MTEVPPLTWWPVKNGDGFGDGDGDGDDFGDGDGVYDLFLCVPSKNDNLRGVLQWR